MGTVNSRKTQIKIILTRRKYLFSDLSLLEDTKPDAAGINYGIIYFPKSINYSNPSEGFPLKDNVGYISIREEIDSGLVVGYTYRFTSDEYIYVAESYDKKNKMQRRFFNFHYQDDSKHDPHVSFLHPSIRYISRKIDLDEFLDFIEQTFFINRTRKNSLPWYSRF